MWPGGVVMDPPSFDNDPGMGQADEPFFVQTFITCGVRIDHFNSCSF